MSRATTGHMTRDGAILGTVRYMAPEQIDGHEVDARSDLFSFGAVVYEMLTGKRAFDGDSATSIRAAILEREPPPVSSLQPLVPPALDDIVRRCLAKDPSERWQTAGDVLRDLKRVAESSHQARYAHARGLEMGCRHPGHSGHGTCRVARRWRVPAWVDDASRSDSIGRGPAARESVRRPGAGVLRRRDDRATHCRPGQDQRAPRDLALVGHPVPDRRQSQCQPLRGN